MGVSPSGLTQYPGMSRERIPLSDFPTCAQCREMGVPVSDTLARMEAALGHGVLVAFLVRHGGRDIEVPARAPATQPDDDVGRALEWLHRDLGAGRWNVPLGPSSARARFSFAVLRRLRAGRSLAGIAEELGCHTRTVTQRKTHFTRRGLLPASDDTRKGIAP